MTTTITPIRAVTRYVRVAAPGCLTAPEVAAALGISPTTVRRRARSATPGFAPSGTVVFGGVRMPVWTVTDIETAEPRSCQSGQPMLWTAEELGARRRVRCRIDYLRKRAQRLERDGDTAAACIARECADQLEQCLRHDRADRDAAIRAQHAAE